MELLYVQNRSTFQVTTQVFLKLFCSRSKIKSIILNISCKNLRYFFKELKLKYKRFD